MEIHCEVFSADGPLPSVLEHAPKPKGLRFTGTERVKNLGTLYLQVYEGRSRSSLLRFGECRIECPLPAIS